MESPVHRSPLSTAALVALQRGNKIEAIKLLRHEQGLGLKDAKDLLEAHLAADPALASAFASAQAQASSRFLRWVVLIGAAAIAIYFFALR
jgi:ribosomal protein L7/L12